VKANHIRVMNEQVEDILAEVEMNLHTAMVKAYRGVGELSKTPCLPSDLSQIRELANAINSVHTKVQSLQQHVNRQK
jgi:hypothetical protein